MSEPDYARERLRILLRAEINRLELALADMRVLLEDMDGLSESSCAALEQLVYRSIK